MKRSVVAHRDQLQEKICGGRRRASAALKQVSSRASLWHQRHWDLWEQSELEEITEQSGIWGALLRNAKSLRRPEEREEGFAAWQYEEWKRGRTMRRRRVRVRTGREGQRLKDGVLAKAMEFFLFFLCFPSWICGESINGDDCGFALMGALGIFPIRSSRYCFLLFQALHFCFISLTIDFSANFLLSILNYNVTFVVYEEVG